MAFHPRNVFFNCPFDSDYEPFYWAIIFSIMRCEFKARCARERDDSAELRLAKIYNIIGECPFGIHDISRTETGGPRDLPRFNMPLELGIFLGAKQYGDPKRHGQKQCIVFDKEPYRYLEFISDIAGHDIKSHDGDVEKLVQQIGDWLRNQSGDRKLPGGRRIADEYAVFRAALPDILNDLAIDHDEMRFGDYTAIVEQYLAKAMLTGSP